MGVEFKGNTHVYRIKKLHNGMYCDCGAKKYSPAQFRRLLRGEKNVTLSLDELDHQFRLAKTSYGISNRNLPPTVLLTRPKHKEHVVHVDNLSNWVNAAGRPFCLERLVNFLIVPYFHRCAWLDLVDNDLEVNLVALEGLNTTTELQIDEAIASVDNHDDRAIDNLPPLPIPRMNRPIDYSEQGQVRGQRQLHPSLQNEDDRDSLDELFDQL